MINEYVDSLPDTITFAELIDSTKNGKLMAKFAEIIKRLTGDDSDKKDDL